MEVTLKIDCKSFIGRSGENVEYYDISSVINGTTIHFEPKPDEKKLLYFLLAQLRSQQK